MYSNHLPAITVDDKMTNTQQQVYNGDQRKYFEFPCIVLLSNQNLQSKENKNKINHISRNNNYLIMNIKYACKLQIVKPGTK